MAITISDLESAFHYGADGELGVNQAFVHQPTGEVKFTSDWDDQSVDSPEDFEDLDEWHLVPGKWDLDLGQPLVWEFVQRSAPQHEDNVRGIFRKKGAYRRYKDFLNREGLLEEWFEFEDQATKEALARWAKSRGITVAGFPPVGSGRSMKVQKAAFIAFPASDFEASVRFYRDLLGLPVVCEGEDKFRFVHFDCGGLGVRVYEWTKPFNRAHTGLQVYVDDVDALHAELRAQGVKFSGGIRDEEWGGRVVTVADPDGNLFDLLNASFEESLRS